MKGITVFHLVLTLGCLISAEVHALSYDWNRNVSWLVTRCFDAREVKAHCEDFSDSTPGSKDDVAELQISACGFAGKKFSYSYEKALPGETCRMHLRKIRRLTKNVKAICITGFNENVFKGEAAVSSKWQALETRRGRVVW